MGPLRLVAVVALFVAGASCGDDDAGIATGRSDGPTQGSAEPTCEEVEAFADALVDTGITYDYQATESPADLASQADAVFGGLLTGRTTTSELTTEDEGRSSRPFVGYEVEITRAVKGPGLREGDRVNVFVEYGAAQLSTGYDAEAVAPGAPVAILAFEYAPLGGLTASIEGFVTSCAEGPLLGWTGSRGEWANLQTVQQVLDAAERGNTSSTTTPTGQRGATAVWRVDDEDPPTTSATSFTALVTRLACSGGETGEVLAPMITVDEDEIVVTFTVEELPDGNYTCPGNDEVPFVVEIGEAIGQRTLVDGACLDGEAASTSFCSEGSNRWTP